MSTSLDRRAGALAVGDHLAIAAVVAWGIVDHHGLEGLTEPREVAVVVGPFVVGYLVAAVLVGCYAAGRYETLPASLRSTVGAWLGGLGLGLVIRTSPEIEGGATWPFGLVLLLSVTAGLVAWRVTAHVVWRYRSTLAEVAGREPAGE